jgi:hypothetical protein
MPWANETDRAAERDQGGGCGTRGLIDHAIVEHLWTNAGHNVLQYKETVVIGVVPLWRNGPSGLNS